MFVRLTLKLDELVWLALMGISSKQKAERATKLGCLALLWSAFIIFLASAYYGNSHGMYLNIYQYALQPLRFSKDVFLNSTFFFDITIVDDLVRLCGFSFFDNEIAGVLVFLSVSLVTFWTINAILKEFMGVEDREVRLLLFLMVAFFGYDKFLEYSEARFIFPHTGTPSFLTYQLKYIFLLLLLRGRVLAGGGVLCLLWAISFNHSWYLIVIALAFHVFKGDWKNPKMAVYLLPLAYILWKSAGVVTVGDPLELIEIATGRVGEEDLIHLNQWINLAVFVASFAVYPLLCRIVTNPHMAIFLKSLLWTTVAFFVFGYVYGRWGWMYFPILGLNSLCFIKVMGLYISFFYLLLMLAIVQSGRLLWFEKTLLLVLVAFWTMTTPSNDFARYFKGVFILVLFWFFVKAFGTSSNRFVRRFRDGFGPRAMMVALSGFMLMSSLYYLRGAYPRWAINWDARMASFNATGKWSLRGTPSVEMVDALVQLRDDPEDMVLIPLELGANGSLEHVHDASFLALKTLFNGSIVHTYMNKPLYDEILEREKLFKTLLSALNRKKDVDDDIISALKKRGVYVFLPEAYSQYISGRLVRQINGFSLKALEPAG